jgi:hypothetical protein
MMLMLQLAQQTRRIIIVKRRLRVTGQPGKIALFLGQSLAQGNKPSTMLTRAYIPCSIHKHQTDTLE